MIVVIQNREDLEKRILDAGENLVVIDFFANWCGPCKIISSKVEELSMQYGDRVLVLKVNVDDCEDIAMEYNVTSMPTFMFIKTGQVIDVSVGGNAEKLIKNLEKYIGDTPVGMEQEEPSDQFDDAIDNEQILN